MSKYFREKLKEQGLKVTPQRVAIFEAILELDNHPTAEDIIAFTKTNYPNISVGTVYKVLDTFVENNLFRKVKTERDVMRYNPYLKNHHHLYCADSDRIEDFEDQELNELIKNYFETQKIKKFKIQDIKLQITGKFNK